MTGQIILVGELDHEQQPRHTLVVKATNDGGFDPADGGPYDPSTDNTLKEVVVNVLDVNDNPHVFLDSLIVTGENDDPFFVLLKKYVPQMKSMTSHIESFYHKLFDLVRGIFIWHWCQRTSHMTKVIPVLYFL